jgi:phosphatidylglycerophosphate synthase
MLNVVRAPVARVLTPVAEWLARIGITPDIVTVVGTTGVSAGALGFYPRGQFLVGTLVITAFVFSDMIDGAVARARGGGTQWGAFLDSSLDRVGDAAVFGGLVLYYAGRGHDPKLAALALYCLVAGAVTSYVRARAEGLGMKCSVGVAERSERLLIVLFLTGFSGLFDVPDLRVVALWVLAVGSTITIVQRLVVVYRQAAR